MWRRRGRTSASAKSAGCVYRFDANFESYFFMNSDWTRTGKGCRQANAVGRGNQWAKEGAVRQERPWHRRKEVSARK